MEIKPPKLMSPGRHLPTAGHIYDVPDAVPCCPKIAEHKSKMPAGWNVRVTTFDSEGKPRLVRNFLAYESDKDRAVKLVRKRVPVQQGELAEAIAEVAGNVLAGPGMRPGDVRRLTRKTQEDDEV
jgi:hypothetical protein